MDWDDRERLAQDLGAAVGARRDLGPEYEAALVRSFVEKVDREVDVRLDARLSQLSRSSRRRRKGGTWLGLGSIALGIPVTGIIGGELHGGWGFAGIVVAWGAIAVVNVSNAIARSR